MIYAICFFPAFLTIAYSFYLLFKPKNKHDEFFHLFRKMKKETIIERIKILEEINQADYSKDIRQIEHFYSDGRITESEANKIEEVITNTYFNHFTKKWIAFKRADPLMKCLFVLYFVYGFIYVNLVFAYGYAQIHQTEMSLTQVLLIVNLTLILPFAFSIVQLGFLTTFLAMLNLMFSEKGGINRATITSAELAKALKPGGRKTQIILAGGRNTNFFRI